MLRHADIDDAECARLMDALQRNLSLTDIDLAHNLIGHAETQNFVKPELEA